ncbi:MAG: FAD-binding oxidoreductase [Arhodomonas sp.]|nr:FAD-binding oxidoreductase [Arhodomonas sp.]
MRPVPSNPNPSTGGTKSAPPSRRGAETGTQTLAFGNGRSYGDSCLSTSDRVLHTRGLDHVLAVDWSTGVIRAEAGMTLGELIALSLPRGWFPAVTPGTQFVTLGGAVANDVHGKNHHRQGSFGDHVLALGLYRSETGHHELRDPNDELLRATIGGLGLTGLIDSVELQLRRVPGMLMESHTQRFGSLGRFLALSRELDAVHEYVVGWVDCLAGACATGRGLLHAGDHSAGGKTRNRPNTARVRVPFTPPISMIRGWNVRWFNALVYHRPRRTRASRWQPLQRFLYPLDHIGDWNRLYGPAGLLQLQCVVPEQEAERALSELLGRVRRAGTGSTLAVLKRFGDHWSRGLVGFPRPGVTLALDFPRRATSDRLIRDLNALVHEAGGRLYPAKDATMTGEQFRAGYPAWERLEALRDPALLSRFWQRVMT